MPSSADAGSLISPHQRVVANRAAWDACPAPYHVVDKINDGEPPLFKCRYCHATIGADFAAYAHRTCRERDLFLVNLWPDCPEALSFARL
jgi:hypothetical protein